MSARLFAMEATPPPANAETAYAATGDHHLFLLTVNAVLAAAIHGGYLDRFEMWRYDVPDAFLQLPLPVPYYGRLPALLTWRSKYEETLQALRNRYPVTLDSSPMDRYLGMGFSYNPAIGSLTASMLHSVLKVLTTFCTDSLPIQRTPYTMDLFDLTDDPTSVDDLTMKHLLKETSRKPSESWLA